MKVQEEKQQQLMEGGEGESKWETAHGSMKANEIVELISRRTKV